MGITIVNYIDQDLVNRINEQALLRQQPAATSTATGDFATVLSNASITYSPASTPTVCSSTLDALFTEASNTYGVSANLLKSIARAESNFNATATSSAGACGIMQLMPSTAASLGVSDIYNVRENIMGGAKLMSQLLSNYSGNTALALAAYNAGSSAVDQYGGIPPYTETRNYVSTVLSYLSGSFEVDYSDSAETGDTTDTAANTAEALSDTASTADDERRTQARELINTLLELRSSNPAAFNLLAELLKEISA